jgi:hypothetical protein
MSESEAEYVIESEDEIDSELEDEYDYAIETYAQLLREVPPAKLDGIVERVQELFENPNAERERVLDEIYNDNIYCVVLAALLVMLVGSIIQVVSRQKTDYINL